MSKVTITRLSEASLHISWRLKVDTLLRISTRSVFSVI